jgi:hypothetical protein
MGRACSPGKGVESILVRYRIPEIIVCFALTGCVGAPGAPPSPNEIQTMQNAPKPSSQEAAQEAVKRYFEESLFDAPAARYQFPLPPTQGSVRSGAMRYFGWFMCGEVNGKNRMGGYTGFKTFFAYFSPTIQDKVIDGTIADIDVYGIVDGWCKGVYGVK